MRERISATGRGKSLAGLALLVFVASPPAWRRPVELRSSSHAVMVGNECEALLTHIVLAIIVDKYWTSREARGWLPPREGGWKCFRYSGATAAINPTENPIGEANSNNSKMERMFA